MRNKTSSDLLITEYRKQRFIVPFYKTYQDIINYAKTRRKIDNILTIILIFSIILAIGALIYVITVPKIGERFTEFYILNSTTRKADNYPNILKLNESTTLLIGIVNHEYSFVNYTIEIDLDKNTLKSEKLELNNSERLEKNMTFIPNKNGTDMKLEFLLFKENNFTSPYRDLHLWVNVI